MWSYLRIVVFYGSGLSKTGFDILSFPCFSSLLDLYMYVVFFCRSWVMVLGAELGEVNCKQVMFHSKGLLSRRR